MVGAIGQNSARVYWQTHQHTARPAIDGTAAVSASRRQTEASAVQTAKKTAAPAIRTPAAAEEPFVPKGYEPKELAARTRLQFPELASPFAEFADQEDDFFRSLGLSVGDEEEEQPVGLPGEEGEKEPFRTIGTPFGEEEEEEYRFPWEDEDEEEDDKGVDGVKDKKDASNIMSDSKCETCARRKYQDGSDDPGVSFKFATRIDPKLAQAAIRGHENEHVVRERAKAEKEGRKVVSQSVTYHMSICPECGKFYFSGGTTRTVTANNNTKSFLSRLSRKGKSGGDFDISA